MVEFFSKLRSIFKKIKTGDIVLLGKKETNFITNNNFQLPEGSILIKSKDGNFALTSEKNMPQVLIEQNIKQVDQEFSLKVDDLLGELKQPVKDKLLQDILPHLDSEFRTVLKLAAYAHKKYQTKKRKAGDEIKAHIGEYYGKGGRKLCNLYHRGYITEFSEEYITNVLKLEDAVQIKKRLNGIIESIVKFTEFVFFIGGATSVKEIENKILAAMAQDKEYIALHSVGIQNKQKILKLHSKIVGKIQEFGYKDKTQTIETGEKNYPLFDIIISKDPSTADK